LLKKKIVKRRARRSTTKKKLYFNEETQQGIVDFQDTEVRSEKDAIYKEKILPAFEKLVENLILIYGFAKKGESFPVLKNDCVTFLYETLHKFDNSKGTKAFSYFNVVGKNWLILNSRRRKKRVDKHLSIQDHDRMSADDKMAIASAQICPAPEDIMIQAEFRDEVKQVLFRIKGMVDSKNDVACVEAVITVFNNLDQLDFLNKRAIFVYVRDISGLNSKQLSASMSTIRKMYRELKANVPNLF